MNNNSVAKVELLYPGLKVKAYQMAQLLSLKGIDMEVSQGLRTWPQQQALYDQGRTAPGNIATQAKPEQSWHTFGCAFDIDIVTSYGLDWTGNDAAWQACIAVGESLGLTAGAEWRTFPDRPHFQLTGRFPVTPDDEVVYLFKNGGLQSVWDEINKGETA